MPKRKKRAVVTRKKKDEGNGDEDIGCESSKKVAAASSTSQCEDEMDEISSFTSVPLLQTSGDGVKNNLTSHFMCNYCEFSAESKADLVSHMRKHMIKCTKCQFSSLSRREVTQHCKEEHDVELEPTGHEVASSSSEVEMDKDPCSACVFCKFMTYSTEHLERHTSLKHPGMLPKSVAKMVTKLASTKIRQGDVHFYLSISGKDSSDLENSKLGPSSPAKVESSEPIEIEDEPPVDVKPTIEPVEQKVSPEILSQHKLSQKIIAEPLKTETFTQQLAKRMKEEKGSVRTEADTSESERKPERGVKVETIYCLTCPYSNVLIDKLKCHTLVQHPLGATAATYSGTPEGTLADLIFFCVKEECPYSTADIKEYQKHLMSCCSTVKSLKIIERERLKSTTSFIFELHKKHSLTAENGFFEFANPAPPQASEGGLTTSSESHNKSVPEELNSTQNSSVSAFNRNSIDNSEVSGMVEQSTGLHHNVAQANQISQVSVSQNQYPVTSATSNFQALTHRQDISTQPQQGAAVPTALYQVNRNPDALVSVQQAWPSVSQQHISGNRSHTSSSTATANQYHVSWDRTSQRMQTVLEPCSLPNFLDTTSAGTACQEPNMPKEGPALVDNASSGQQSLHQETYDLTTQQQSPRGRKRSINEQPVYNPSGMPSAFMPSMPSQLHGVPQQRYPRPRAPNAFRGHTYRGRGRPPAPGTMTHQGGGGVDDDVIVTAVVRMSPSPQRGRPPAQRRPAPAFPRGRGPATPPQRMRGPSQHHGMLNSPQRGRGAAPRPNCPPFPPNRQIDMRKHFEDLACAVDPNEDEDDIQIVGMTPAKDGSIGHPKAVDASRFSYCCLHCGKDQGSKKVMKQHMKACHNDTLLGAFTNIDTGQWLYFCPQLHCEFMTYNEQRLSDHLQKCCDPEKWKAFDFGVAMNNLKSMKIRQMAVRSIDGSYGDPIDLAGQGMRERFSTSLNDAFDDIVVNTTGRQMVRPPVVRPVGAPMDQRMRPYRMQMPNPPASQGMRGRGTMYRPRQAMVHPPRVNNPARRQPMPRQGSMHQGPSAFPGQMIRNPRLLTPRAAVSGSHVNHMQRPRMPHPPTTHQNPIVIDVDPDSPEDPRNGRGGDGNGANSEVPPQYQSHRSNTPLSFNERTAMMQTHPANDGNYHSSTMLDSSQAPNFLNRPLGSHGERGNFTSPQTMGSEKSNVTNSGLVNSEANTDDLGVFPLPSESQQIEQAKQNDSAVPGCTELGGENTTDVSNASTGKALEAPALTESPNLTEGDTGSNMEAVDQSPQLEMASGAWHSAQCSLPGNLETFDNTSNAGFISQNIDMPGNEIAYPRKDSGSQLEAGSTAALETSSALEVSLSNEQQSAPYIPSAASLPGNVQTFEASLSHVTPLTTEHSEPCAAPESVSANNNVAIGSSDLQSTPEVDMQSTSSNDEQCSTAVAYTTAPSLSVATAETGPPTSTTHAQSNFPTDSPTPATHLQPVPLVHTLSVHSIEKIPSVPLSATSHSVTGSSIQSESCAEVQSRTSEGTEYDKHTAALSSEGTKFFKTAQAVTQRNENACHTDVRQMQSTLSGNPVNSQSSQGILTESLDEEEKINAVVLEKVFARVPDMPKALSRRLVFKFKQFANYKNVKITPDSKVIDEFVSKISYKRSGSADQKNRSASAAADNPSTSMATRSGRHLLEVSAGAGKTISTSAAQLPKNSPIIGNNTFQQNKSLQSTADNQRPTQLSTQQSNEANDVSNNASNKQPLDKKTETCESEQDKQMQSDNGDSLVQNQWPLPFPHNKNGSQEGSGRLQSSSSNEPIDSTSSQAVEEDTAETAQSAPESNTLSQKPVSEDEPVCFHTYLKNAIAMQASLDKNDKQIASEKMIGSETSSKDEGNSFQTLSKDEGESFQTFSKENEIVSLTSLSHNVHVQTAVEKISTTQEISSKNDTETVSQIAPGETTECMEQSLQEGDASLQSYESLAESSVSQQAAVRCMDKEEVITQLQNLHEINDVPSHKTHTEPMLHPSSEKIDETKRRTLSAQKEISVSLETVENDATLPEINKEAKHSESIPQGKNAHPSDTADPDETEKNRQVNSQSLNNNRDILPPDAQDQVNNECLAPVLSDKTSGSYTDNQNKLSIDIAQSKTGDDQSNCISSDAMGSPDIIETHIILPQRTIQFSGPFQKLVREASVKASQSQLVKEPVGSDISAENKELDESHFCSDKTSFESKAMKEKPSCVNTENAGEKSDKDHFGKNVMITEETHQVQVPKDPVDSLKAGEENKFHSGSAEKAGEENKFHSGSAENVEAQDIIPVPIIKQTSSSRSWNEPSFAAADSEGNACSIDCTENDKDQEDDDARQKQVFKPQAGLRVVDGEGGSCNSDETATELKKMGACNQQPFDAQVGHDPASLPRAESRPQSGNATGSREKQQKLCASNNHQSSQNGKAELQKKAIGDCLKWFDRFKGPDERLKPSLKRALSEEDYSYHQYEGDKPSAKKKLKCRRASGSDKCFDTDYCRYDSPESNSCPPFSPQAYTTAQLDISEQDTAFHYLNKESEVSSKSAVFEREKLSSQQGSMHSLGEKPLISTLMDNTSASGREHDSASSSQSTPKVNSSSKAIYDTSSNPKSCEEASPVEKSSLTGCGDTGVILQSTSYDTSDEKPCMIDKSTGKLILKVKKRNQPRSQALDQPLHEDIKYDSGAGCSSHSEDQFVRRSLRERKVVHIDETETTEMDELMSEDDDEYLVDEDSEAYSSDSNDAWGESQDHSQPKRKKSKQPPDPTAFDVKIRGKFRCWLCKKTFLKCGFAKSHLLKKHADKGLCALDLGQSEFLGAPQLLLFCPKKCRYATVSLEGLRNHVAVCEREVLNPLDVAHKFMDTDYEELVKMGEKILEVPQKIKKTPKKLQAKKEHKANTAEEHVDERNEGQEVKAPEIEKTMVSGRQEMNCSRKASILIPHAPAGNAFEAGASASESPHLVPLIKPTLQDATPVTSVVATNSADAVVDVDGHWPPVSTEESVQVHPLPVVQQSQQQIVPHQNAPGHHLQDLSSSSTSERPSQSLNDSPNFVQPLVYRTGTQQAPVRTVPKQPPRLPFKGAIRGPLPVQQPQFVSPVRQSGVAGQPNVRMRSPQPNVNQQHQVRYRQRVSYHAQGTTRPPQHQVPRMSPSNPNPRPMPVRGPHQQQQRQTHPAPHGQRAGYSVPPRQPLQSHVRPYETHRPSSRGFGYHPQQQQQQQQHYRGGNAAQAVLHSRQQPQIPRPSGNGNVAPAQEADDVYTVTESGVICLD